MTMGFLLGEEAPMVQEPKVVMKEKAVALTEDSSHATSLVSTAVGEVTKVRDLFP
jgi:hypothetical protein